MKIRQDWRDAQLLRALDALGEDQGLVPSTHMGQLSVIPVSEDLIPSSLGLWVPGMHVIHKCSTHRQNKYVYTLCVCMCV